MHEDAHNALDSLVNEQKTPVPFVNLWMVMIESFVCSVCMVYGLFSNKTSALYE